MDVLEMVFPGTLLQQIEQKQHLASNDFGSQCFSKCSAVANLSMAGVPEEPVHTSSLDVKPNNSLTHVGSCQQAYEGLNDLSKSFGIDASGVNTVSSVTDSANVEKPIKKTSKRKNKKKGKSNKMLLTESCHSSKEEIGHAKDDKIMANGDSLTANYDKKMKTALPLTDTPLICSCGHTVECLKDASNFYGKLFFECSCSVNSDLTGSQVPSDVWSSNNDDHGSCGRGSNGIMQGVEGLNTIETTCPKKTFSSGCLSEHSSYETNSAMSSTTENCNGRSIDSTKPRTTCFYLQNVHAFTPRKEFEHDKVMPQSDTVNKTSHRHNIHIGKENSHSISQKSWKAIRNADIHESKRSSHTHVGTDISLLEERLLAKHNSFPSDALLPSPIVSSIGHYCAADRVPVRKNVQGMNSGIHGNLLVQTSQWVAQQRLHSCINQYGPRSQQNDNGGNKDLGKSKEKLNQSSKHENINYSRKGAAVYKPTFFRLRNKMILSQKEALEVPEELHHNHINSSAQSSISGNQCTETEELDCLHTNTISSAHIQLNVPCKTISGVSDRALLHGVQSYAWMKIPRTEHGLLHGTLDNEPKSPARMELKLSYGANFRRDYTPQVSLQKWIPVGRKDSGMLKSMGAVGSCNGNNEKPTSCKGKANNHLENSSSLCLPVASVDPGSTCLISTQEIPETMTFKTEAPPFEKLCANVEENQIEKSDKDYVTSSIKKKDAHLLCIGSQMAIQALNTAYKLQIASESVELATGSPLAEFERLLHSATPVIVPAFVLQHCNVCAGNQHPCDSLCKHQVPNISLGAVWKWYEKPGNYGLEVKAEDPQNLKGLGTDLVQFHAHFVPFLSAIQLFGHPQHSKCCSSTGYINSEITDNRDAEQLPRPGKAHTDMPHSEAVAPECLQVEKISVPLLLDSVEEPVSSVDVSRSEGSDSSGLTSIRACSEDKELIFEFFEFEQPQLRKPLYDKIMDLIKAGTPNHHVFGDPSKLECLNLRDIHPASWYSVAWYPIYRIPEGNFRASFLTYHSLGHLVQRCISTDSIEEHTFSVVSPVLGLQSYNAQGECWFCPKKAAESSFNGSMHFDRSEILKERLRTLEKTALFFARGCVHKDHVKFTNRQPDFEFFLSRKR